MSASAANALSAVKRWTRDEITRRVAQDIPEGAVINLGICVLGASQVSAQGDLAIWRTGIPERPTRFRPLAVPWTWPSARRQPSW